MHIKIYRRLKKKNQVYLMIQKLEENIGNNNLKKSFMFGFLQFEFPGIFMQISFKVQPQQPFCCRVISVLEIIVLPFTLFQPSFSGLLDGLTFNSKVLWNTGVHVSV